MTALRSALAQRMGSERLALWFGADTALALDGTRLLVLTPSPFFQEWLRRNFRAEIQAVAREVIGRDVTIEFTVAAAPADAIRIAATDPIGPQSTLSSGNNYDAGRTLAPPASASPLPLGTATAATLFSTEIAEVLPAAKPQAANRTDANESKSRQVANAASQAPAIINEPPRRGRRFARLEEFAAGQANRLALAAAQTASAQLGTWSPLTLYGPSGVGKTHLLEGIWSAVKQRRPETSAIYLTAEQFTTGFLDALRGSGLPSFRRKYRGVDLLIIDDIQFFAGKRATLVELLHTMNTLVDDGRQLVLAADRPPQELAELGVDVVQRLAGGMLCRLDRPDFEARLAIVERLSSQYNLSLPEEVRKLLAAQLTQGAREIAGALKRLAVSQLAHGGPITLAGAQETLVEQLRQASRSVRLPDIERAVCDLFGLEARSLQSGRRARQVSHPRALAMWLARKYTRAALSEIGDFFGCRSHTTVISAQRKVGDWLANQHELEISDGSCRVEDAVRRIERLLAVG